ncbi:hypothetical protein HOT49_gp069 [Erwinia phage vB_EamM_Alexandra]|uniref:Uncharacterized protein n=1 Tax=Erwinia phage vB_EamM_Alexandra TaxID=2201424 RepID=A0A2Z4QFX3_9CAUD|nr:hypothetical protein HOT49_gp069 [Erwinia phage vB_EamM_Alexandra]AWY08626.1 hypothetical protein Alexandra_69 [Erwinia phage vB_EamM_Alexandra]
MFSLLTKGGIDNMTDTLPSWYDVIIQHFEILPAAR